MGIYASLLDYNCTLMRVAIVTAVLAGNILLAIARVKFVTPFVYTE